MEEQRDFSSFSESVLSAVTDAWYVVPGTSRRLLLRRTPSKRIEVRCDVPGYDLAPPICIYPEDLPSVAGAFRALSREPLVQESFTEVGGTEYRSEDLQEVLMPKRGPGRPRKEA